MNMCILGRFEINILNGKAKYNKLNRKDIQIQYTYSSIILDIKFYVNVLHCSLKDRRDRDRMVVRFM
jgi:hypothetical protein